MPSAYDVTGSDTHKTAESETRKWRMTICVCKNHRRRLLLSNVLWHIFNLAFLSLIVTSSHPAFWVLTLAYQLCILPKSKSHLISHRVFDELTAGKLGVEFPTCLSLLGWKIVVNERSLCEGNLEEFYHIKKSIVFVLFYTFSVCLESFPLNFNLIPFGAEQRQEITMLTMLHDWKLRCIIKELYKDSSLQCRILLWF